MKTKTKVKAGANNGDVHVGSWQPSFSKKGKTAVKVKTNVKAGGINLQHNQTVARALKVKTGIKAGQNAPPTIRD
jgi:hypothetical protein